MINSLRLLQRSNKKAHPALIFLHHGIDSGDLAGAERVGNAHGFGTTRRKIRIELPPFKHRTGTNPITKCSGKPTNKPRSREPREPLNVRCRRRIDTPTISPASSGTWRGFPSRARPCGNSSGTARASPKPTSRRKSWRSTPGMGVWMARSPPRFSTARRVGKLRIRGDPAA